MVPQKLQNLKVNAPDEAAVREMYEKLDDMDLGLAAARNCLLLAAIKSNGLLSVVDSVDIRDIKVCSEAVHIAINVIRKIRGLDNQQSNKQEVEVYWHED